MSVVKSLKSLGLYRTAQGIRDSRLRGKRLAFYSMIIKPRDLCFDIGANIGSRTDIFLRLGAKVVAIEPQIEPFQYLIKRFEKNSNFIAINKALGARYTFFEPRQLRRMVRVLFSLNVAELSQVIVFP